MRLEKTKYGWYANNIRHGYFNYQNYQTIYHFGNEHGRRRWDDGQIESVVRGSIIGHQKIVYRDTVKQIFSKPNSTSLGGISYSVF